jgi:hypothetical protein
MSQDPSQQPVPEIEIVVELEPEFLEAVIALAKQQDTTTSVVLKQAIRLYQKQVLDGGCRTSDFGDGAVWTLRDFQNLLQHHSLLLKAVKSVNQRLENGDDILVQTTAWRETTDLIDDALAFKPEK